MAHLLRKKEPQYLHNKMIQIGCYNQASRRKVGFVIQMTQLQPHNRCFICQFCYFVQFELPLQRNTADIIRASYNISHLFEIVDCLLNPTSRGTSGPIHNTKNGCCTCTLTLSTFKKIEQISSLDAQVLSVSVNRKSLQQRFHLMAHISIDIEKVSTYYPLMTKCDNIPCSQMASRGCIKSFPSCIVLATGI